MFSLVCMSLLLLFLFVPLLSKDMWVSKFPRFHRYEWVNVNSPCLVSSATPIDSRSTIILSRIKCLLKMGSCTSMRPSIYPSICYLYHLTVRVMEKLKPITAAFERDAGYTLAISLILPRASTETNNQSHSHLFRVHLYMYCFFNNFDRTVSGL